jgi:hypothetical protein
LSSPRTGYRSVYTPFFSLVFFGQLGNGDLFAQPALAERVRDDVFVWNHEDDSRMWYASDVWDALNRFFAPPAGQRAVPH